MLELGEFLLRFLIGKTRRAILCHWISVALLLLLLFKIRFNVCIEPLGYGRLIIHGFVPLLCLYVSPSSSPYKALEAGQDASLSQAFKIQSLIGQIEVWITPFLLWII